MQNIKEKLINLLKISIMYIDKRNVKSEGLTIISNSEFSKKSIDKAYKVDSLVIYPGINVKEFIRNTSIKKRNQILSVGAINKLKGYEFIIEVVSKIEKELRPDLVIVGNGGGREYLAKIKKLAKTLHVNLKVKINITRPLLIEEYLASKLFIYAPINEPFGIVVEEAMAAGLPVVGAKNGGGYSEILSNDNGALIDSSDSQLWAKKLSTILRDNAILRKIGQYNFKYVQKYYTDKIMNDNLWKVISSI
jgi:glycosyltransferase involved in cell wall biosynthesis